MNVLVAEPVSAAAIELLKKQSGWNIIVSNPKEYQAHLAEADALLVRSAVKVTGAVLAQAPKLRVIGRAGVGVDNVDLIAATAAGVIVMNTPGGNAVSVAEHTLALMLAMARSIPQATASTKSGKWEKKKFLGNELRGKTLGIIGLGSIGREVVRRARVFEMRILASDPYVSAQTAQDLNVELADLPRLYAESDYISMHVGLTPETREMLNAAAFAQMKDGVRIVNCARGELINDEDLKQAIESGKVAGTGLDVFTKEPPAEGYPLFSVEPVIATPHIAGSTEEAQEIVGIRIVEQMVDYLQNGVAINAVNMPALSAEEYKALGPYVTLAERLGFFAAHLAGDNPKAVRFVYSGQIAENNTHLLRNAGLAGVLNRSLSQKANLVNAMGLAAQRGLDVAERHEKRSAAMDSVRVEIEAETGVTVVEGGILLDKPRLLQVDGIYFEAPLSGQLLFMKNDDVPGVIGHVGSVLGRNSINIANFSLGRRDLSGAGGRAEAFAVVETDQPVSEDVIAQLRENKAVKLARSIEVA
jgi:D-3-phosphoglycerate dehydrogenase / 2-oxoglutarate reductase